MIVYASNGSKITYYGMKFALPWEICSVSIQVIPVLYMKGYGPETYCVCLLVKIIQFVVLDFLWLTTNQDIF